MCQIKVADIQVKQNFVFENFTNSAWKTIKYNNFTPIEGITIYSTSDQESQFGLKGDQPVVYNVARIGIAPGRNLCYSDTGIVEFLDNNPAKMFLKYHNKRTGQTHQQNQWVLYTDYDSMAVVYACQKEEADGTCHADHRYIWILAKQSTLTPEEEALANKIAASVCISGLTLKTVDHNQPCPS